MKRRRDPVSVIATIAFAAGIALQILAYDRIIVRGFNHVSRMVVEDPAADRRTLQVRVNEQIAASVAFYATFAGIALVILAASFAVVASRKMKQPNQALEPTRGAVTPRAP